MVRSRVTGVRRGFAWQPDPLVAVEQAAGAEIGKERGLGVGSHHHIPKRRTSVAATPAAPVDFGRR
jgi:hypothetical protein